MRIGFWILGALVHGAAATKSPYTSCPTPSRYSEEQFGSVGLTFLNNLNRPMDLFWVDEEGREHLSDTIQAGESGQDHHSYWGHVFRARTVGDQRLVWEGALTDHREQILETGHIVVHPCDDEERFAFDPNTRAVEFAAMVHNQSAPCVGPRHEWSCVRSVSDTDYADRLGPRYGFSPEEVLPGGECAERLVGQVYDDSYVDHIEAIPHLSQGPGYLKMQQPAKMREALQSFFAQHEEHAEEHSMIYGCMTNNHAAPFHHINLDRYRDMHQTVVAEMHGVLEWWTQQKLIHTSTFGIRLYHRNATLLNHVDRGDSHLASAVIQVAQDVDEGEGWPLEVVTADGGVKEVYLQPGEMVLYEGAWVMHGRPERFKGRMFANIFTHYAPLDWAGPPVNAAPATRFWDRTLWRSDGTHAHAEALGFTPARTTPGLSPHEEL